MEAEPTKAEPPKRNRPRFQFRLRTLLIGMTVVAVLCAATARFVDERQRLIQERDRAIQEAKLIRFAAEDTASKSRLLIQIERQRREAAEKRAAEAERSLDSATQP